MTHVVASFTQSNFRFRNDDGSQTTATWRQSAGVNDTVPVDTTFRLRIEVREVAGATNPASFNGALQYSLNSGTYTDITTSSSVVRLVTSSNVSDDTATTEQLAGPGTFVAGVIESDGSYSSPSLSSQDTEIEFVLSIQSADVANADTIDFRISGLNTYSATPRATVQEAVTHNLTANPLTGGTFTLGQPTLGQTHNATANPLTGGAFTLDQPALGQVHDITADDLAGGTFTLGQPVLTESHDLTADDLIGGTLTLDQPALGQIHGITADDLISGTYTLDQTALTESHDLTADDLIGGTYTLDQPALGQIHGITADDLISGTFTLDQPALTESHDLTADDLISGTLTLDQPVLDQIHNISANDLLAGTFTLSQPILSGSQTYGVIPPSQKVILLISAMKKRQIL